MKLSEILNLCSLEHEVRVFVGYGPLAPTIQGEADALSKYLNSAALDSEVCAIGIDDGRSGNSLQKIWVAEVEE